MRNQAVLAFCLFWSCGQAFGGEPSTQLRIRSDLVLVDVVVRDRQGGPVHGLKAHDFEVSEEKHPQEIVSFEFIAGSPANLSGDPEDPTSLIGSSTSPFSTTARRRNPLSGEKIILAIDKMSVDGNALVRIREAMTRFFQENFRQGDQVMLVEIDNSFRVSLPFTSDIRAVLEAVDRMRPAGQPVGDLDQAAVEERVEDLILRRMQDPRGDMMEQAIEAASHEVRGHLLRVTQRATTSLQVLAALSRSLQNVPGRKSLIYLSFGFPLRPGQGLKRVIESTINGLGIARDSQIRERLQHEIAKIQDPDLHGMVSEVVSHANRAHLTLYAIDARGLLAVVPTGEADRRGSFGSLITGEAAQSKLNRLSDAREFLATLAYGTGGLVFYNNNDLARLIDRAYSDLSDYYLLGYRPSKQGKPGDFRDISVKVNCGDCEVRHRNGYLVTEENLLRQAELFSALTYPDLYSSSRLEASLNFFRVSPGRASVRVDLAIPSKEVLFLEEADKLTARLAMYGLLLDERGQRISEELTFLKGFDLKLSRDEHASLRGQYLRSAEEFDLQPGRYTAIIVVRDEQSSRLWVSTERLEIPTLEDDDLALSSLVLSQEVLSSEDEDPFLSFQGRQIFPSPDRRFSRDRPLWVYFHIYGPGMDEKRTTSIWMTVRVLDERGQPKLSGRQPISEELSNPAEIRRAASIPLHSFFPGEYSLVLEIEDQVRRKTLKKELTFRVAD